MPFSLNPPPSSSPGIDTWEDDGSPELNDPSHHDLNFLLAQEQTAIMNAEASTSAAGRDGHRAEARLLRELVDQTPYPDRSPHDFDRDPAAVPRDADAEMASLIQRVERNETRLATQLATGLVTTTSFQHRSRVLRQERDRLSAGPISAREILVSADREQSLATVGAVTNSS